MRFLIAIIAIIPQIVHLYGQNANINNINPSLDYETNIKSIEPKVANLVYTFTGNLFTGNDIQLKEEEGKLIVKIDDIELNASSIKFLKINNEFWANANGEGKDDKSSFGVRTYKGNANLFTKSEIVIANNYSNISLSSNQIWGDNTRNKETRYFNYYNIGYGEVKEMKYRNLIKDLSDNVESVNHLKKAQGYKSKSIFLYMLGATSFFYGFSNGLSFSNTKEKEFNALSFYLPIGIGISSIWLGTRMSKKNSSSLIKAVKAY